jgi:hypothetical protein
MLDFLIFYAIIIKNIKRGILWKEELVASAYYTIENVRDV